jgi:hypothetical protein
MSEQLATHPQEPSHDPHSFSRQLARLQDSLRAAANPSGNQRNSFAELVADDVGDQLEQRSSIG